MQRLLTAAALAISLLPSLQSSLASAETPPSIPYEKYRLANGLEVILSQDRALPLVAVAYHTEQCLKPNSTARRRVTPT